jgi:HPt (histidine-containing phosphotransfer) domain-containing protein
MLRNVIDRARIEELAGGPEGVAEVLAQIASAVRADIDAVEAALAGADGAGLRSAAHRIMGSALTIGAEGVAASAALIVDAPAAADASHLAGSARALLDDLKRLLDAALRL